MAEVGTTKYFGMPEAPGVIATLFVILHFLRKHGHDFERIHGITQTGFKGQN
jgi:hypothetical protein